MFFDDDRKDDIYPQIMLSIAKVQRALLNFHFNWSERKPIQQKKSFFGGRKKEDQEYDRLLGKLDELKLLAQKHREEMGYGNGVFWWNLPWTKLEDYLIYDLTQEREAGSWRFQRTWETQKTDSGELLLLHEEGHFSSFSKSTSYDTGIISSFSEDEINDKMRDYDRMMNKFDLETLAYAGDKPVKSYLSGIEYESGAHYLLSSEHLYLRDHYKTQYARSLYTETETTTITVSSNSRHYEAFFAVAEFAMHRDILQSLLIHNYVLCGAKGNPPQEIQELYKSKDAAVSCAAFLADHPDTKGVPLKLFGNDIKDGAVSFQDAVRQAEIYTCLANKIIL